MESVTVAQAKQAVPSDRVVTISRERMGSGSVFKSFLFKTNYLWRTCSVNPPPPPPLAIFLSRAHRICGFGCVMRFGTMTGWFK